MSDTASRIQVLSPTIVNKIAAGEVIERPASVVKELVENSIDAGARRIDIDVAEGGTRRIKVSDDGDGIHQDDLGRVFVSHATSKLSSIEDLEEIVSLGFRGEALASIGSVSRATVRSRPRGDDNGQEIECFGGEVKGPKAAGIPYGTVTEVCDLFFNTPARLKFLKQASTELIHIVDIVIRLAISHPEVALRVRNQGKLVFEVESDESVEGRVRDALGRDLTRGLIATSHEEPWGTIKAFLAPPDRAKRRTKHQLAFVNGRSVRDRTIMAAVRRGYGEFLASSLQPVYVLFLTMSPRDVDVNVHPTKAEVRFRQSSRIFSGITHAIDKALREADLVPRARLFGAIGKGARTEIQPSSSSQTQAQSMKWREGKGLFEGSEEGPHQVSEGAASESSTSLYVRAEEYETESATPLSRTSVPSEDEDHSRGENRRTFEGPAATGRILQAHRTYLLYEVPEGLMVVDQHALHERLVYESLKKQYGSGQVVRQNLVVPKTFEVSRAQVLAVDAYQEKLMRAGVELTPFGETTLALHSIPVLLQRCRPEKLVEEILESLEDENGSERHDLMDKTLYTMACHRSIRGGDFLNDAEMRALIERAEEVDLSQACPHGRPTRVVLEKAELEKLFKRRGF